MLCFTVFLSITYILTIDFIQSILFFSSLFTSLSLSSLARPWWCVWNTSQWNTVNSLAAKTTILAAGLWWIAGQVLFQFVFIINIYWAVTYLSLSRTPKQRFWCAHMGAHLHNPSIHLIGQGKVKEKWSRNTSFTTRTQKKSPFAYSVNQQRL